MFWAGVTCCSRSDRSPHTEGLGDTWSSTCTQVDMLRPQSQGLAGPLPHGALVLPGIGWTLRLTFESAPPSTPGASRDSPCAVPTVLCWPVHWAGAAPRGAVREPQTPFVALSPLAGSVVSRPLAAWGPRAYRGWCCWLLAAVAVQSGMRARRAWPGRGWHGVAPTQREAREPGGPPGSAWQVETPGQRMPPPPAARVRAAG